MITITDLNNDKENFNWWLTCMEDVLAYKCLLPLDIKKTLDYTVSSLDTLEIYILENFTSESIFKSENKFALDFFARYVGQTFFKNIPNLKWSLVEDEKDFYNGKVVLEKKNTDLFIKKSPLSLVIVSLDRKKGNFISEILVNNMKD
ncbi:hypothetical protein MW871_14080 [Flavobacterium sp. I-SCBP12n]|uniref:Uncharacterized protein n=1 Tax=Flavobacterium pygoscelis TaxID=2893176 RepID=A0A9X1XWN4_9FLAO|nr:hypothetical protein [Flavobacterium pygoscelis]MCK8143023.1 hypothetical protein [Flavobacterium pygoscelis]